MTDNDRPQAKSVFPSDIMCGSIERGIGSPEEVSAADRVQTIEENGILDGERSLPTSLSLCPADAVEVSVHDLSVSIDLRPSKWAIFAAGLWAGLQGLEYENEGKTEEQTKVLLQNVSAVMPKGSLTAVIGSSGAGKTTLLNVMAGRTTSHRLEVQGSIEFNGRATTNGTSRAYLKQDDKLIPTLTVRETLQYSASLRLPPSTTRQERRDLVEQVIGMLGLNCCGDTQIGKGCSDGEKRRTSIGIQMLANSSVLFCDEPTTGTGSNFLVQFGTLALTMSQA